MVPERHQSARSCSNFGSTNCYEVHIAPDESRVVTLTQVIQTSAEGTNVEGTVDLHNIRSLQTVRYEHFKHLKSDLHC